MKREFNTLDELNVFAEPLFNERKYVIQATQMKSGKFNLHWIEHKQYTTHEGTQEYDEVWANSQGDITLVQDMSETHVRNALRLMLRNEREAHAAMEQIAREMEEGGMQDERGDEGSSEIPNTSRLLH